MYRDPIRNDFVIQEGGTGNYAPSQSSQLLGALSSMSQFNALMSGVDHGLAPLLDPSGNPTGNYDPEGSAGPTQASAFTQQWQSLSQGYTDARWALAGQRTGVKADMAQDILPYFNNFEHAGRHCVQNALGLVPNSTEPHWESLREWIYDLTLSSWSYTIWHEFGHSIGLDHNFMGSVDRNNWSHWTDKKGNDQVGAYLSSIMEYPATAGDLFLKAGAANPKSPGARPLLDPTWNGKPGAGCRTTWPRSPSSMRTRRRRRRRIRTGLVHRLLGLLVGVGAVFGHQAVERHRRMEQRGREPVPPGAPTSSPVTPLLPDVRLRHDAERDRRHRARRRGVAVQVDELPPVPQVLGRQRVRRRSRDLLPRPPALPLELGVRLELADAARAVRQARRPPARPQYPGDELLRKPGEQLHERHVRGKPAHRRLPPRHGGAGLRRAPLHHGVRSVLRRRHPTGHHHRQELRPAELHDAVPGRQLRPDPVGGRLPLRGVRVRLRTTSRSRRTW